MTSAAATVTYASLDEIIDNSYLRDVAVSWLVRNAGTIQGALQGQDESRRAFNEILAKRQTDPSAAFQGSIILISGALEAYLASAVNDYLMRISSSIDGTNRRRFETLILNHTARSGYALQYLPSGNVLGASFDFARLQKNLAKDLANDDAFEMAGDVFMLRFGTCYPEKIEKLFEKLGLSGPFDVALGKHKSIAGWAKDRSPTSAAQYLRSQMNELANLRNDLAHGHATSAVNHDIVVQFGDLVRAFVDAIDDRLLPS